MLDLSHPEIKPGGWWRPSSCLSRHHVAIVIPYRDRDAHLRVFLHHMIPIFQRQQLNFRIFVIEQVDLLSPYLLFTFNLINSVISNQQPLANHLFVKLNMIYLRKGSIELYEIFINVPFQNKGVDFNRGILMNIGYIEALRVDNYRCFVFSDVDLLLQDDRNIYGCPEQPRHLSVIIDTHGSRLVEMFVLVYK